jgi:aspartate racemase
MKTVGIIGGLGPETTAEFYLNIINKTQERYDKKRPPILRRSVSIPYEIERDSILRNIGVQRNIPYILNEARGLENGGADFIVMPCNSLHVYIDDLRSSVDIPVLSIIDESVKYIQKQGIQNLELFLQR